MNEEPDKQGEIITRRRFLSRLFKAGTAIAASAALGGLLYDASGPSGETVLNTVSLPDYSIPGLDSAMAVVRGSDRKKTLRKAIEVLGGIERFIKPGDRVLIKVNAAFASPPILSATSHPDLVSECITLCLAAGALEVRVTDNPINDPASCFQLSGIGAAVEKAGGRLILPKESLFAPYTLKGGRLLRNWPILYEPLDRIDKLIGMAPVKDHHRSGASMTMKNWYGLLGGRRNIFHQDIHTIIKELAMMVRPTLVILDGTTTMMTNGPTGGAVSDLKKTGTLIVSTDQVAADAFGATLLERTKSDLPFIGKAREEGVGTDDFESLRPARASID